MEQIICCLKTGHSICLSALLNLCEFTVQILDGLTTCSIITFRQDKTFSHLLVGERLSQLHTMTLHIWMALRSRARRPTICLMRWMYLRNEIFLNNTILMYVSIAVVILTLAYPSVPQSFVQSRIDKGKTKYSRSARGVCVTWWPRCLLLWFRTWLWWW